MTLPLDPESLDALRREYDVIPVVRELSADTLTPVSAFDALSREESEAFLLESVDRGETLGRYSFIGIRPRRSLRFDRGARNPCATLEEELVPLKVWNEENLPPFVGGAVGFFGYGVARWRETLPDRNRDPVGMPDAKLLFFDDIVVFDHLMQKLYVIANVFSASPAASRPMLEEASNRVGSIVALLREATVDLTAVPADPEMAGFDSNFEPADFLRAVDQAKEQISAGEAFQIVLSQCWSTEYPTGEALTLYRALRSINPSPYMFLLRMDEGILVGASPEMLVREHRGLAETRPIAGTRPRGRDAGKDEALERDLLADPKENAEHLMLVDLGRNDLGRVCQGGSVRVTEFGKVERYSHVMHIVSHVVGRLREDRRPIDLLLSAFPAGTVSGAPKIRAMEIIDELEPTRRGP
ncbi:MAG: chorismate-binding protein, partial [Thermoanaerobaculia bacterium]|nr:chorismate-binding protein [Thermoanaerobaculia bacterium]